MCRVRPNESSARGLLREPGDLRRNDLVPTVTFQRSVAEPKGVVLAQSPDPFAVVKRETTVVLVVSAGP